MDNKLFFQTILDMVLDGRNWFEPAEHKELLDRHLEENMKLIKRFGEYGCRL